ncbi:MAG: 5-formyltetrahydrofolate cyclo-ligase [Candidatus Omnitrophica bacterium 4484_70.1]|nr:MAG: 5-formyltetrahydrofolate cyclo-ligase [Candidatus Omnitrophica bacterium 4484_70.1]
MRKWLKDKKVDEEKESLRREILKKFSSFSDEELKRRSKNVERNLQNLLVYKEARCILAYYPLRKEVNILGILKEALEKKQVCFPVIDWEKEEIVPYQVKDLRRDFVRGRMGIKEPDISKTREVELERVDVVIVPGLAFDKRKNRLGRGKGFYDRFLKRLEEKTKKVGVIFDFQLLESLPFNFPQDEKVDLIVTESSSF